MTACEKAVRRQSGRLTDLIECSYRDLAGQDRVEELSGSDWHADDLFGEEPEVVHRSERGRCAVLRRGVQPPPWSTLAASHLDSTPNKTLECARIERLRSELVEDDTYPRMDAIIGRLDASQPILATGYVVRFSVAGNGDEASKSAPRL